MIPQDSGEIMPSLHIEEDVENVLETRAQTRDVVQRLEKRVAPVSFHVCPERFSSGLPYVSGALADPRLCGSLSILRLAGGRRPEVSPRLRRVVGGRRDDGKVIAVELGREANLSANRLIVHANISCGW